MLVAFVLCTVVHFSQFSFLLHAFLSQMGNCCASEQSASLLAEPSSAPPVMPRPYPDAASPMKGLSVRSNTDNVVPAPALSKPLAPPTPVAPAAVDSENAPPSAVDSENAPPSTMESSVPVASTPAPAEKGKKKKKKKETPLSPGTADLLSEGLQVKKASKKGKGKK